MRHRLVWGIIAGLTLLCGSAALAVEWRAYPDFRHCLGLPGNNFAVRQDGEVGSGGCMNMVVPCAYTPARGNYSIGYSSGSKDSGIALGFSGADVDGAGYIGIGLGKPGRSIYFSELFVEDEFSVNAFNLQWQVMDEDGRKPAVAIGVLDILNQRPDVFLGDHGGRSFYITATKQIADEERPCYLTLGFGTDRFNDRPFGAVSWYPTRRVNLGFEYDGMMPRPYLAYEAHVQNRWSVNASLAWSNFDRPVVGLSLSRCKTRPPPPGYSPEGTWHKGAPED